MELQQSQEGSNSQSHEHGPVRTKLKGTHPYDPVTGELDRTRACEPSSEVEVQDRDHRVEKVMSVNAWWPILAEPSLAGHSADTHECQTQTDFTISCEVFLQQNRLQSVA
eukprot:909687-Amphidinium_carterae.1